MDRLLLQNALLVDGTGAPPYSGDLLVEGDRIVEVGTFERPSEAFVVECTGLAAAPGFIDAHSHSDLQVIEGRTEKAAQGVTSEVVGNCGFSAYPLPPDPRVLHEFANGILCGGDEWGWKSAGEYLAAARRSKVNVFSLVGHGSLRVAHAGMRSGRLEPRTLDAMAATLRECLDQGACGFSTGLMYYPGSSAPPEELEALCRVVARTGKLYTTHMRNYSEALPEAVDEQIDLARRTGCRVQISHLQAVGRRHWGLQQRVLEKIERAAAGGVDIAFDCYPYVAGSTVLTQFLPQWALAGGTSAMLARFADRIERRRIIAQMKALLAHEWTDLIISSIGSAANQGLVGLSLEAIAGQRGCDPPEAVIDLLTEERGAVNILEFNQSEENLRRLLTHPLSIVVSDGFYVKGRPHPRLYGALPKLLGTYCRSQGIFDLADAIHKITGLPARRFGMSGRGRLARGCFADLTVFDAETIDSPATYENSTLAPIGIHEVIRNGRLSTLPLPHRGLIEVPQPCQERI